MGQGKNEGVFASTESSLCFCLKNYKFVPKQNKLVLFFTNIQTYSLKQKFDGNFFINIEER